MHKDMFCAGEMIGWEYDDASFSCSCGAVLKDCPFYQHIGKTFVDNGLPFSFSNFGTAYQLFRSGRLNNLFTRNISRLQLSAIEKFRDNIIRHIPVLSGRMQQFDRANELFMATALEYSGAHVFIDASKDPYRFRHLKHINSLDIKIVHLVRDLRGVIHSFRKNSGITDLSMATQRWVQDQADILRLAAEFPSVMRIYYEEICNDVDSSLAKISNFVDEQPINFSGDFKSTEHHILGNSMRLDGPSKIVNNERWKKELTDMEINTIQQVARNALLYYKNPALEEIIEHYLEN